MLDSGRFIFGPEVEAFEREAAAYLGVPHAIGVANGTDALVLSLEAMGIGAGDEVICPAFTFYATAEAIARVGATPVFAEIDPTTLNLDPGDAAARITERTKAIMPVHLFGRPAALPELAALGLPLVEDSAQAFGATGIATTGVCSTFSFFPTKNLFALGDGGLVACMDDAVADTRADAPLPRVARQADVRAGGGELAAGRDPRCCPPRVPPAPAGWNASRRAGAALYAELGLGELVELPVDQAGHVYHMYVVRSPERDRIAAALRESGISSAAYYVTPLHLQPALQHLGWQAGLAARDRARRCREPRAPDVGWDHRGRAGARRGGRPLRRRRRRVGPRRARPISRHRAWQVGVDARARGGRLVARLEPPLRRDGHPAAPLLRPLPGLVDRRCSSSRSRSPSSSSRGSTTAGGATSRPATCGACCAVSPWRRSRPSSCSSLFEVHRVRVPSGVWFIDLLLCLALVAGARLLARTLIERPRPGNVVARGKEVVVVGAGDAAQLVVKEMLRNPALGMTPIGLVDDDPRKKNLRIHGVRVLGTIELLGRIVHEQRPDEVLIAIPSAAGAVRQRVVDVATAEGVPVKTLPSISELVTGDYDLAGRCARSRSRTCSGASRSRSTSRRSRATWAARCVLVTGAGGSIGSELCRQVARLGPSRLVLVDHAEPALFEIERELVRERGFTARRRRRRRREGRREAAPGASPSTGRASSSTPPRTSTWR